jgi:hypothetical protein
MSLDYLEDALNDFLIVQVDIREIERAMDKSISSMDIFKASFEKFLRIEEGYVKEVYSSGARDSLYRLYGMHEKYDKLWRRMAEYETHLRKMGYGGFSKDLKIEMSGLAALMNRIQDYKNKLR